MLKRKVRSYFYSSVILVVGFLVSAIAFAIHPVFGYAIMAGLFTAYYYGNYNAKRLLHEAEKFSVRAVTSLTSLVVLLTVARSDSEFIYADKKQVVSTIKEITAVMQTENDRIMG